MFFKAIILIILATLGHQTFDKIIFNNTGSDLNIHSKCINAHAIHLKAGYTTTLPAEEEQYIAVASRDGAIARNDFYRSTRCTERSEITDEDLVWYSRIYPDLTQIK